MEANTLLAGAKLHANQHPEELPCDPGTFGVVCAYLAALAVELDYAESQLLADLDAGRRKAREALASGYRQYLRGVRPVKPGTQE